MKPIMKTVSGQNGYFYTVESPQNNGGQEHHNDFLTDQYFNLNTQKVAPRERELKIQGKCTG